jgi:hypothetical protein
MSARAMWPCCLLVLLSAGLALVPGCAKKDRHGNLLASGSGKVTYKGIALTSGVILLSPESGPPSVGQIRGDGSFSVDEIPVGTARVSVESPADPPAARARDTVRPESAIPLRYSDPSSSGLTWELKPGSNSKNFDLTD